MKWVSRVQILRTATATASVALLLASAGLSGCGGMELASRWRDGEITVDGDPADWQGKLVSFDDADLGVGVVNDGEFLYVCVTTADQRVQRQILGAGLTLWFDAEGGNERSLGIRYPPPRGARGISREEVRERIEAVAADSTAEMDILGPDEEVLERVPIAESPGVEVRIAAAASSLVYEMRISLARSDRHPVAVGARVGERIGVGLATAKPELPDERRGGGPFGGGKGGGSGGGRGGRGRGGGPPGGGRPGGPAPPEPLDVWARVQLATEPPRT